jgi:HEPN domain-containing protein
MEMDFMRKRADAFFTGAEDYFEKGEFALSAFSIEQAVQLQLKYFLWSKLGDFPKTHKLSELFDDSSKLCSRLGEVYDQSVSLVSGIEDAYIMTRYFDKEYKKTEVEAMIQFYRVLVSELKKCD